MKVTQLRDKDKTTALTTMDMETWIEKTRTEIKTQPVSVFREALRYSLPDSRCYEADKLPKILPAAEFHRTESGKQLKYYNGIVELTVGPLSGRPEIILVKQLAWEQPQTHCVFTGSSGRTVKIWVKFTRPDASLPQKREEAELFHAHAYRLAVKCSQPQIPFNILPKEPTLEQFSRLSHDPELRYRPDSVPFYLSQSTEMPTELSYREAVRSEKSPLTRAVPGYDTEHAIFMLFEAALRKTHEEIYQAQDGGAYPRGEDFQAVVTQLAVNCFHSGIPEEETVKRTIFHYYLRRQETLVRQLVKNVYNEQEGFGKKNSLGKEQFLALQTEEFMKRRYEFRYNTQVGEVEYRERNSFRFYFNPIDKRVLNSIALDAQGEGIPLWDRDISRYIYSNRIPVFNPLEDFLYHLPVWDGKDRIRGLARTVPCNNPHWVELFHRWFLNMVVHWRGTDTKYANNVSPLLVGEQGCRKSTFCRSIIPPAIRAYYTDSIDFSRKKDAELYLNRFALINIDEFDQISAAQQGFLKHILQKPIVNIRRPRGTATQEMRRYASFIGTSNHKDLLTDTSGSRRYIVINVTGPIDCSPIDYEQLYTQAIHDLYKGERYWFDTEDEKIITENNQEFQVMPVAEQLFHEYFRAAKEEEEEYEQLLAIEILEQVQHDSKIRVSVCSIVEFGRILQKNKVPCVHTKRGNFYKVVRIKPGRR